MMSTLTYDFLHRAHPLQCQLQERTFLEAIKFYRRSSSFSTTVASLIDITDIIDYSVLNRSRVIANLALGRCPSACGGMVMRDACNGDVCVCSTPTCATKVWYHHMEAARHEYECSTDVHGSELCRKAGLEHTDSQPKRRRTS